MPRKKKRPLGDEDFEQKGEDWREPVVADAVDEASRESMDASDPPARSVVTRTGDPKRPSDPRPREPVTR
jgi:hypothetical protein